MTETQTTMMQIPPHIDMTRRIAADLTATVTKLAVTEQQLMAQLDEHRRTAAQERDRIEAELRATREAADRRLAQLADEEQRITGELQGVGRQLQRHRDEVDQAAESLADWCTRRAIDPADLPPLRDTGPMPAIPAVEPRPEVVDLARHVGQDVVLRTFGGTKIAGRLIGAGERVQVRQDDGTDCYVAAGDVVEVMRVAEIAPPLGFDPNSTGLVVAQVPDMTIPDTGLAPALLVPAAGNGHRKPGPLQRLTRRTGGQAASDAAESPADEQNEAAS